ncbi:hypothetical protein FRB99_004200, partial [Tulasnella sp. 403]
SYVLGHLAEVNLTVVARSNFDSAREGRITLRSAQYGEVKGFKPTRVCISVAEAADQPYDFVIVTTKALPELYPTSELLAPLLSPSYPHPQPTYVLIQNGLGVERDLYQALAKRTTDAPPAIITSALYVAANMVGDEVIHGKYSRLQAGFYQPDEGPSVSLDQNTLHDFISLLVKGGVQASVVPNIAAAKYRKNIWNATFATTSCLTRYSLSDLFNDESLLNRTMPVLRGVIIEVLAVGRALGYTDDELGPVDGALETTRSIYQGTGANHKPSALLDVEQGKPFELEVILGEVVRHGQRLGVPIPRLEMLYGTLYLIQAQLIKAL